jgi:hypothetical protein
MAHDVWVRHGICRQQYRWSGKQPVGTMNTLCEKRTFDKAGGAKLAIADEEE